MLLKKGPLQKQPVNMVGGLFCLWVRVLYCGLHTSLPLWLRS